VPGVSTDVGSCKQLVYGLGPEDQALGASGSVVGIADSQALAEAIIGLFEDESKWFAASAAGVARVNRFYTHPLMFGRYREVYRRALSGERADEPGFKGWAEI
jgi:polysaccharide biosynthesis protein PelF